MHYLAERVIFNLYTTHINAEDVLHHTNSNIYRKWDSWQEGRDKTEMAIVIDSQETIYMGKQEVKYKTGIAVVGESQETVYMGR